jgi:murein DD-endopeptidase MepM/ murein hydrolase activator NlpD
MAGRVSDVGYNANYGNYIIVDHADGFQTLYGHLSSASAIEGATVEQGTVIGLSGNTGYSTGPHLHFGLFKRSLALNPLKYLK